MTRIIDAETVQLDDSAVVRLAGALAPRQPLTASGASTWPALRQSAAALSRLVEGQTVEVVAEKASIDRYGRRRAQLFVLRDGGRRWVQAELIALGQARAYAAPGEKTSCLADLLAFEAPAREASRGLWSNAAFKIRRAERAGALMRFRSTFQLVEGVVREVANVRGATYLNFGANWREDFTAGKLRRGRSSEQTQPFDAAALKGQRVRVRGWIERRNGPFIEIVDWAQIELLDKAAQRSSVAPSAPPLPEADVEPASKSARQ